MTRVAPEHTSLSPRTTLALEFLMQALSALFLIVALSPTATAGDVPERGEKLYAAFEMEGISAEEAAEMTVTDMLNEASVVTVEPEGPGPIEADILTTCVSFDNNATWSCNSTYIDDCSANGIDWPVLMLDIGTFQTCTGMA